MAEPVTDHSHPVHLPGWVVALCRLFAGIGGLTLVAMMLMTVTSVVKRGVFGAPIPGDYELMQMGCAIAIFCFLPWCQAVGGNVLVDFFTQKTSPRLNHLLEALGDLLYLLIAALLMWRMYHGGLEAREYGDQSMVLRLPAWWGYAIAMPAMGLLAVTSAATMISHFRRAFQ